jgi:hypothetical protein
MTYRKRVLRVTRALAAYAGRHLARQSLPAAAVAAKEARPAPEALPGPVGLYVNGEPVCVTGKHERRSVT